MITLRGHHLRALYTFIRFAKTPQQLAQHKQNLLNIVSEEYRSDEFARHTIRLLERALNLNETIALTDTLDDICDHCVYKQNECCTQSTTDKPKEITASMDDDAVLEFYGLEQRTYQAVQIHERLLQYGEDTHIAIRKAIGRLKNDGTKNR